MTAEHIPIVRNAATLTLAASYYVTSILPTNQEAQNVNEESSK